MDFAAGPIDVLEYIRAHAVALPQLTKFALGMAFIFGVLALSRRLRLPAFVGLLFSGVVLGRTCSRSSESSDPSPSSSETLATAGPIMTQHYAPLMLAASTDHAHHEAA